MFWVESGRTVSWFRKRKKIFCVVLTYSIKRASEIRKVSCRSRATTAKKCTKKRDACAKLFSFQFKPIAFLLLQKLPIVVVQKFCYHSKVTSHFSSLLKENRPHFGWHACRSRTPLLKFLNIIKKKTFNLLKV